MAKKVYVITGPIGSGKSTAIKYLKNKGFSTVDLDRKSTRLNPVTDVSRMPSSA